MFGSGIRDFDIHREVLSELDWSQDVHSTEVGVQVNNGIVTLAGTVSSSRKKVIAVEAAHRVEGVRAVVDAMIVHLPAFDGDSDAEVARNAVNALNGLGREAIDHIRVTISAGCVTLGGQVRTRSERLEAEQHLRSVAGVTDIINGISVVGADLDINSIHSSIEHSFQHLAQQAARRISIETDGSKVVLKGTVVTWAERDEAERAALAAGATSIENQIQVYPHAHVEPEELVYIAG
jgi:osmotically-inducible protein OsmY